MSGTSFRKSCTGFFLLLSIFLVIMFVKKSPMNLRPLSETHVFDQYQGINNNVIEIQPPYLLPCNQGPYIWDKKQRFEGIGSEFQWHKPSFTAAHLLNGKWIGNLTNEHFIEEGDQSSYFGLTYSHCDEMSLRIYKDVHPNHFIYTSKGELSDFNKLLSFLNETRYQITERTVIVFEWQILDESHNYFVFDTGFRSRFYQKQLQRQILYKRASEYWISVHFRWGDVKTTNPDKSDLRNGLGFSDYCTCINQIQKIKPQARIYFFAENFEHPELCFANQSKTDFHFFNDSMQWKRDLDIMSQSNLIVGGSSSFFVLGAFLCQNCSVIHNTKIKFAKSNYERNLSQQMKDFYCNSKLSCYLEQLNRILQ